MNRFVPVLILWGSLAVAGVCGMVSAMRNCRVKRLRRTVHRAGKLLAKMSSLLLHMFV